MSVTLTGKYIDCGSRSAFYRIGKGRGFKEFPTKYDAKYSHRCQTIAAEAILAPAVYSEVGRIRLPDGELSGWGYITQIARPLSCTGNCHCEKCDYIECKYLADIEDVTLLLDAEFGICYEDSHVGNFGWIRKNGIKHLVCVDFGPESCFFDEAETEECYA